MRLTDDDGDDSVDAILIRVHGWVFSSLDDDSSGGGYYPQMEIINGKPVLAHATIPFTVRYGICTDSEGLDPADWSFFEIDSTNAPGRSCSLALINGNPAVAYFNDAASNGFSYKRSTTQTGSAPGDWPAAVHFGSGTDGLDVSLAEVNGKPAIAYDKGSSGDLGFQFSSTDDGMLAGNWTQIVIEGDATNTYGQHPELLIVDGKPAVAYRMTDNLGNGFLRYAYSSSAGGTAPGDWTKVNAASLGSNSVWYPSLAVINGNPAIAYQNQGANSIHYVRATTSNGSAWSAPVLLELPAAGADEYPALNELFGKPVVAFTNSNTNDPYLITSNTALGDNDADWAGNVTNMRPGGHPEGRMMDIGYTFTGRLFVVCRDETSQCVSYGVLF